MSRKQNVRQQELKERLKDMLRLARAYIESEIKKDNKNPYNTLIVKAEFLARYRVTFSVGYYASERYYSDFETLGYFETDNNLNAFKVNHDEINKNPYKIEFPQP